VWKIIDESLKAEDLHGLLPFIHCSLHVAHNAFRYGLKEYGSKVDQLCLDLFYWVKQSPCKQEDFLEVLQEMELEEKYFIRHVQSQWLTLGPVTVRVIKHYAAVCDYFSKHLLSKEHEKNDNYCRICACLKDKNTITKLKFVASLANIFPPFLKLFQTEDPGLHILHDECCSLVRRVFGRYLKADILNKKIKRLIIRRGITSFPILR